MKALVVWAEGTRVGVLTSERGTWSFVYDSSWLGHEHAFPLSPHFPLTQERFSDGPEDRRVLWFFENLLPEGGVRQALARFARVSEHDVFGLLERFGEESAGALTLLPEGQPFPNVGTYAPMSREELRSQIVAMPSVPLIAVNGRARMSLAGVQQKIGLHRRGKMFLLPEHAASSSILKPDNARPDLFPFCPANEHFCMTLARETGIPAPATELLHLPEPAYVVDRFDRGIEGGRVVRRHQIDLCQLLNKWPGYKYESEGGATFEQAYRALDATRQPAVARRQLLRWLIFNYLIGNSDAHAKNISFLVTADGIELAPAYDLLSVRVYGADYDYLAMTIGGELRYEWLEERHWSALAESIGLSPPFLARLRQELAERLPDAARALSNDRVFKPDERGFLEAVIENIETLSRLSLVNIRAKRNP